MLVLLILVPLIWILRFKDRIFGFVLVSSAMIAGHASIAILLQIFGIFNFNLLLILHIIVALVSILLNFRLINFKFSKKIPWAILIALFIVALQFYFVHFNYSGKIISHTGVSEVENFRSTAPSFSDEWITVAVSESIIETGRLPLINPFNGVKLVNFLFVFQSFISEIDLLFDLDLLSFYPVLSIIFSILLLSFVYILLRELKISVGISVFVVFMISYLPNSSNLPILWNLLPWNIGLLFLISYFIAIRKNYAKTGILLNLLAISFYPPISILAVPSLFFTSINKKLKINYIIFLGLGIIFAGILSSLNDLSTIKNSFNFIFKFLFRPLNSALGEPPLFIIWRVLPFFMTPFALYGLWKIRKEYKFISVPIFITLILWLLYSLGIETIVMDYHRTVAISGILLLIASAFGLKDLVEFLKQKYNFLKNFQIKNALLILMLVLFFVLSFSFTKREGWIYFKTFNFDPAPPVSKYLTDDDLALFKDIKNSRFISPPWKGLTIAVATKNIPIVTKPSTITVNLMNYNIFLSMNCQEKLQTAKKLKIQYFYIPETQCEGIKLLGKSSENLFLYLVE